MEYDWARGDVIQADGVEVAQATRSWFRDQAEVRIGHEVWTYRAQGWGRGTVVADADGAPRFTARRSGLFTARWTLDVGSELALVQAGWASSRLDLVRGGTSIASCWRSGLFNGRPRLELTQELDVPVVCFVLWLAYREYNRQSSDGGAAAAAT
ncbi:hypothetical protein EUA93_17235 [Nocardioides oleivorans]|uniref:Uncharacterized protein n=1 Tax=Nocardioides oleivorans TaxID=273676 RepID=A0A4V1RKD2_9ACTN|nr:hypothetical protein [Nocardioides oleivorans]RYB91872.1 hypothetical protein EUA93_17235 [Nocardioides oleivorans]